MSKSWASTSVHFSLMQAQVAVQNENKEYVQLSLSSQGILVKF